MDKIGVIFDQVNGVMFSMHDEERALVHESVPSAILNLVTQKKAEMDVMCEEIAHTPRSDPRRRELVDQLQRAETRAAYQCNRALRKLKLY